MPVKLKGIKKVNVNIKSILPDARSNFAIAMKKEIVDLIVEKIVSGNSPVKGNNRYKKYSKGYAKTKGRSEPVDLVKSGNMLNNLYAKITNKKNILILFRGGLAAKLASYHQNGLGRLPVRKILPAGREIFKVGIMKRITALLDKAVKKAIK